MTLAPKVNVKKDKKVRKTISVQIKQEIIEKHKRGVFLFITIIY
jgi:hypothetical protein